MQAAAVCVLDVSSTVALQLPALQGALAKSFGLYAAFLQVSDLFAEHLLLLLVPLLAAVDLLPMQPVFTAGRCRQLIAMRCMVSCAVGSTARLRTPTLYKSSQHSCFSTAVTKRPQATPSQPEKQQHVCSRVVGDSCIEPIGLKQALLTLKAIPPGQGCTCAGWYPGGRCAGVHSCAVGRCFLCLLCRNC